MSLIAYKTSYALRIGGFIDLWLAALMAATELTCLIEIYLQEREGTHRVPLLPSGIFPETADGINDILVVRRCAMAGQRWLMQERSNPDRLARDRAA